MLVSNPPNGLYTGLFFVTSAGGILEIDLLSDESHGRIIYSSAQNDTVLQILQIRSPSNPLYFKLV